LNCKTANTSNKLAREVKLIRELKKPLGSRHLFDGKTEVANAGAYLT